MSPELEIRLFVYGSLLPGETDHALLEGARHVGPARTPPGYQLVELNAFPALIRGGQKHVAGEVYVVGKEMLRRIDVKKEHPILFRRETIELVDADRAETYLMDANQVRGRRRLKVADWRERFHPQPTGIPASAWSRWARRR